MTRTRHLTILAAVLLGTLAAPGAASAAQARPDTAAATQAHAAATVAARPCAAARRTGRWRPARACA
jgi:hypothetical protein